ncbi:MAG: Protein-arginine-phosphatase [Planctomycetota bacterium]|jgi:protein-tyrosine phosphatase
MSAPRIEKLPDAPPSAQAIELASSVLRQGGVLALPTESVYGLCTRADLPAGLARVIALTDRPADLPFTWVIGNPSDLQRFPQVSRMVERVVAKYWPGPLTLELPGVPKGLEAIQSDGWTRVRLPAHQGTRGILAAQEFPLVLASTTSRGSASFVSTEAVLEGVRGPLDLVFDGGPARLPEEASVLRLGKGRFELVRPGLFTIEQLRKVAGLRIALVCTGNTCRSPMAEGLARALLEKALQTDDIAEFGFEVRSMGVAASVGDSASRHAVSVLREAGIEFSGHRARAVQSENLARFERIYCMTRSHRAALLSTLPPQRQLSVELLDPEGRDVPDPIGGSLDDYRHTAVAIERALKKRLEEWL